MSFLDLLFPRRCVECGKLGGYFCKNCSGKIKFIQYQICPVCEGHAVNGATHPICKTKYTLDGLTSFFHYDGPIRGAVKLLKYKFVSDLASEFVSLIPSSNFQFLIHNSKFLILVPIPLHPSRFRFRGFNQAEILGRLLADKLNSVRLEKFNPPAGGAEFFVSRTNPEHSEGSYAISVRTNILRRTKKTKPQVEMKDRKKRLTNMENVFSVHQLPTTNYQRSTILLFDDVFTTGATLRGAANVLKRAGAKKVWGLVMAHG